MDRTILHCDCNGFYASVECLHRPELKKVPMAVCGNPDSRHGIILAKNELAKAYYIQTAETVWQAKKKCPELVLVPPRRDEYQRVSRQINAVYARFTDLVEPFSIDESWLDVTGSQKLFGDGKTIADTLRRLIRDEVGITISVGVSFNKVFAKMGSDYKKPDATTVITRENAAALLYPLPVTDMLFVGASAANTLGRLGIRTIGDLAGASRVCVAAALGKLGETIYDYACGRDDSPVRRIDEAREMKSVGNSITFSRNLESREAVRTGVMALADSVASRLRRHGLKCRTVQVVIKYPSLKSISRQQPLDHPTDLARELTQSAMSLIEASWSPPTPIRMLGVTAAGLTDQDIGEQLSLFEPDTGAKREKQERLENAMDKIREKFGPSAVQPCVFLGNSLGIGNGTGHDSQEEDMTF